VAPDKIVLRIDAGQFGADLVEELKGLFEAYPGQTEVTLEMTTRDGVRRLRFGDGFKVDPDHGLRAELDQLLGPQALAA
jgi:DNA polymerase-3 subunit alpha